jgi:hypothetical protein
MYFNELDGDQRRTHIDTVQVYDAYREACDDAREYAVRPQWVDATLA